MIICSKCGAPNLEINLFCKKCHYTFPREKKPGPFQSGSRSAQEIRRPVNAAVEQLHSRPEPAAAVVEKIPIPNAVPAADVREVPPAAPAAKVHPPRPRKAPRPQGRLLTINRKVLYAGLGAAAAVALFFAAYGLLFPTETRTAPNAEQFYSRAEQLYAEQQLSQARQMYQQFIIAFPGDTLTTAAKNRIDEINAIFQDREIEKKQREEQIEVLMAQAEQAFRRRQYLAPPQNNAVAYLQQVLAAAPNHPGALEMQQSILDFYREKAAAAEKNRRYREAQRYYENVLAIQPKDSAAIARLSASQEALRPGRAPAAGKPAATSPSSSQPSTASLPKKTEPASLKPPAVPLKNGFGPSEGSIAAAKPVPETKKNTPPPPKTEPQSTRPAKPAGGAAASQTAENTAKSPSLPPKTEPQSAQPAKPAGNVAASQPAENTAKTPVTPPQAAPQSTQPAANVANTEPASQKPAAPQPSPTTPGASSGEIAVVTDALISKEYLHKETPVPPAGFKGAVLVLAECIVGVNGEVEAVTILSAGNDPRLSELTVDVLKKYRYKPATYNGAPVRFKTIEAVKFAQK